MESGLAKCWSFDCVKPCSYRWVFRFYSREIQPFDTILVISKSQVKFDGVPLVQFEIAMGFLEPDNIRVCSVKNFYHNRISVKKKPFFSYENDFMSVIHSKL